MQCPITRARNKAGIEPRACYSEIGYLRKLERTKGYTVSYFQLTLIRLAVDMLFQNPVPSPWIHIG